MSEKVSLIKAIINGLISIQGLGPGDITKGDDFGLPRLIPTGTGETIQINKVIDDEISRLAQVLKSEKPQLVKNVREEEWRSWVRSAIGPALMQVKFSDPVDTSAANVLALLEKDISSLLSNFGPSEYAFGTAFLQISGMPPLNIGPVTIEHREDWINRKLQDKSINATMHARIMRVWQGAKIRPRAKNIDNIRESDIKDALGNSPFVCSVKVDGLSGEAGREIALSAARLGLACVSLVWEKSARVLSGMNLRGDSGMMRERTLRFVPGKVTLQGSRIHGMPSGPSISNADWQKELATRSDYFSAAGEILTYLVSADGKVPRPKLMNALMQSMLWFYEGCREGNDLIAIVDFAASLDALGGGKKARAILQVLEARLGADGSKPIYQGGPTLSSVIDTIYSDGRSRAIHGTSDKIGHDWARTRSHAETLARLALFASVDWAGANPTIDDPALLKK